MTNLDDIDLPEDVAPEPRRIVATVATDLHLGAAEVRGPSPWAQDPEWWIKQQNLGPPAATVFALDCVVTALASVMIWLVCTTVYWLAVT